MQRLPTYLPDKTQCALNRLYCFFVVLALSNTILQAQAPKLAGNGPDGSVSHQEFVKKWMIKDLEGFLGAGFEGGRHYENGRTLFSKATCLACHRFKGEGNAAGPDLSLVVTKYGPLELLTHIIDPNLEISKTYKQTEVTLKDRSKFLGLIIKLTPDKVTLNTDIKNSKALQTIDRKLITSMEPSKVSMMPSGIFNTFHETDILDILAYLLSQGDREDPMFK